MRLHQIVRHTRYRLGARLGRRLEDPGLPPLTVILLSYQRPWNMDSLARGVLRAGFVDRVLLSNNNPEIAIGKWVSVRDDRLVLMDQRERRRPGFRHELARARGAPHYMAIDDDLFLRAGQLRTLYRRYLEDPAVPHGIQGMRLADNGGPHPLEGGVRRIEGPVDVLNRVYVFSRRHVEEFFRLLEATGRHSTDELKYGDDILLSFAGDRRPRCHDVGRVLDCPTSERPGIALYKMADFEPRRADLYRKLRALKPLA